jgi:hypothetical protein
MSIPLEPEPNPITKDIPDYQIHLKISLSKAPKTIVLIPKTRLCFHKKSLCNMMLQRR